MTLQQEQDILAQLFTDRELRERLLSGSSGDLSRSRQLAIAASEEVQWFAESLISKRLREVEKLLPLTAAKIGRKDFEERFRRFSTSFTPTAVKKHLEDALKFSHEIVSDRTVPRISRHLIRFESRRLHHAAFDRTISYCILRLDPRRAKEAGIGFWIAIGRWSRILFLRSRG